MLNLPAPQYAMQDVYDACVAATLSPAPRSALIADRPRVFDRCTHYETLCLLHVLHTMIGEPSPQGVYDDLYRLYDNDLVPLAGVRHYVYMGLRQLAQVLRCPLCSQRDVATLDHYLPRATYPEFSVFPRNLVPCCWMCNLKKGTHVPAGSNEQLFHPYYDNWSTFHLLRADVQIGTYVDVLFYIDSSAAPAEVAERAEFHLSRLVLDELYTANAASELRSRKLKFRKEFLAGGAYGLRRDLQDEAASCSADPNTWRSALYRALADSAPFYAGGFESIDD